ncbi:hypothetical protein SY88_06470 [Clostridiales bacterium PH28_bin88]|nr:hypothetical protein SY88_06470 [Clostridiales bacterium PH28_bin88]
MGFWKFMIGAEVTIVDFFNIVETRDLLSFAAAGILDGPDMVPFLLRPGAFPLNELLQYLSVPTRRHKRESRQPSNSPSWETIGDLWRCRFGDTSFLTETCVGSNESEYVVFSPPWDGWPAPAAAFAALKGADLVSIEVIMSETMERYLRRRGARFFTVFGPPDFFTPEALLHFGRIADNLPWKVHWGIITAPTATGATDIVTKNCIYSRISGGDHLLFLRLNKEIADYEHEGLWSYGQRSAGVGALDYHRGRFFTSFGIHGHSREDLMYLSDGYVCGRDPMFGPIQVVGAATIPHCGHTPGKCFLTEGIPVDPASIPAAVWFVNGCMTFKLGDAIFPHGVSLMLRSLSGYAGVFVGSNLVKMAWEAENRLFLALLRAGWKVGEIVRVLNAVIRSGHMDTPGWYLVGDPSFGLLSAPQPSGSIRIVREEAGHCVVQCNGIEGYVVTIDLQGAAARQLNSSPLLIIEREEGAPELHYLYESDYNKENSRIYLFSGDWLQLNDYYYYIHYPSWNDGPIGRACRTVLGIRTLRLSGIKVTPIFRLEEELENSLSGLANTLHLTTEEVGTFERRIARLESCVSKVQERLCNYLAERVDKSSEHFSDLYRQKFWLDSSESGGPCQYCSNPTHRQEYRSFIDPQLRRVASLCPRCGFTFDGPDFRLALSIHGTLPFYADDRVEFLVRVKNQGTGRTKGIVTLRWPSANKNGIIYEVPFREFDLREGQEGVFLFAVRTTKETITHVHLVKAFAIVGADIFHTAWNTFLLPARESSLVSKG